MIAVGAVGALLLLLGLLVIITGVAKGTGSAQSPRQSPRQQSFNSSRISTPLQQPSPRPLPPPVVQTPPKSAANKTFMVGGNGGGPFEKPVPSGQNVIGFRHELGSWGGKGIIRTFDPLHSKNDPALRQGQGTVLWARDGYIVYGAIVDGTQYTNAIRVIFARLQGNRVVRTDTYMSDWIGVPQNEAQHKLAGDGSRVVGTFGRKGLNMDAFGLLVMPEK